MAHKVGSHGETIELTDAQARRLTALNAVLPVDAPLTYGEMTDEALASLVKERGINVKGSGANGEATHEDHVSALTNYDVGVTEAQTAPPA